MHFFSSHSKPSMVKIYLLFVFNLAEGMIQGIQIGGRVQGRELEVGTGELVRRPEAGQFVVTNQESGDHHGAKL